MLLTLDIDLSNKKAQAFIDFIQTIDFIKIKDEKDADVYALSEKQINVLEERKQRHISKKSKSYSWKEIQEELRASTDD